MKTILLLLIPAMAFAQKQPAVIRPDTVPLIYNALKEGEQCALDVQAANELIASQSLRIKRMADEAKATARYVDNLIDANEELSQTILDKSVEVAKIETKRPLTLSALGEIGIGNALDETAAKAGLDFQFRSGSSVSVSIDTSGRYWVGGRIKLFGL